MSNAFNLPTEAQAFHLGTALGLGRLRRAAAIIEDQAMSDPDVLPLETQGAFELLLLRAEHLAENPPTERVAYEREWFRIAAVARLAADGLGDADTVFNRLVRGAAKDLESFAGLPDQWGVLLRVAREGAA